MEILEAFDLTGTLRGAAELAGCDHKTVAHWVRAREEAGGGLPVAVRPRPRVDAFAEKIEEWVDRSRGRIRADVAHQRLVAMGYLGSERTTRRAVAAAKRRWRAEHGRRYAAVDGRAGAVDAVGLRRRPEGRRPLDGAVLRVAGVVALPRDRSAVGSDDAVGGDGARSRVAGVRRRADLRADRQRADGVDRPRLRDGGAQPADRLGRPPLRADDRELRAGRPAVQGRLGGDGPDRQGRSGPDRAQPARRIRGLRRSSRPRASSSASASTRASTGSRGARRR